MNGVTRGASKKTTLFLIETLTATADEPTCTVRAVPLSALKSRRFPGGWTPTTRGVGEFDPVTCTQQGPEVPMPMLNFLALTA